ncbi:MAG: hypothetical protein OEZ34_04765 [Spirochaetia bacterium]|nr:hypothetical protein [Spirochaetia bacterium]
MIFFCISPGVVSQDSKDGNLQERFEKLDAFFKIPDGVYRGRYEIISGKQIAYSDVVLYSRGKLKAYHFFSASHGRYAVFSFTDRWYFYDLLRKQKILLNGRLRKEAAGDIGFSPGLLYSLFLERNYEPEKLVPLSSGKIRIFAKGILPESYKRISIEMTEDYPVILDLYDQNLELFQSVRYFYRNEMTDPSGNPADQKNFPDKIELMELKTKKIFRMTFYRYESEIPDMRFIKEKKGSRGFFYAPQTDHSSLSR